MDKNKIIPDENINSSNLEDNNTAYSNNQNDSEISAVNVNDKTTYANNSNNSIVYANNQNEESVYINNENDDNNICTNNQNDSVNDQYRNTQPVFTMPEEPTKKTKKKKTGCIVGIIVLGLIGIFIGLLIIIVVNFASLPSISSTSTIDENGITTKIERFEENGQVIERILENGKVISEEILEEAKLVDDIPSYEDNENFEKAPTINIENENQLIPTIVENTSPSIVTIENIVHKSENQFPMFGSGGGGTGSGIIFKATKSEILIVTNNHVVSEADELEVTFTNGDKVSANLLGYSSLQDIAVLSVNVDDIDNADSIKIAQFGNSDNIKIGETVVAIGNPLGSEFSSTVTSGIISALGRSIDFNDGSVQNNLMQTDAAINPGNSGGALLNSKGKVIGINNGKYVAEEVEGIGFAIPINEAKSNIEKILSSRNGGDIAFELNDDRPVLGVSIQDIDSKINYETGMTFGVYVISVSNRSGAKEAGIERGDIIYGMDGSKIRNKNELFAQMALYEVGDVISLDILRHDELITIDVELYSYKDIK